MKLSGKLPPWAILALFLVLGLALIFIPHFFEWRWDYGITPEIGIALVVASILGFTIDRWMRAELRRDVFLASIGHVLAPEFRSEVSRIVGYSLVCERHQLLIKIEGIGNDLVRITSHIERAIRNRSAYPQSIKNITHIDEWGYQKVGTAEVIECILEIDGTAIDADEAKKNAYSVYRETREETLKPDQVANLRSKYVARCTQVHHQLLLQHAACLNKQTPIDRFVRYLHALVGRELPLQPARDLLRRPLERELLRDAPA
jgi:hypothetical protein